MNGKSTHLGAIRELVGGQVDLAKGAFANEAAEGVIANRLEVLAREFAAERQPPRSATKPQRDTTGAQDTHSRSSWYEVASWNGHQTSVSPPSSVHHAIPLQRRQTKNPPWPFVPAPRPSPLPSACLVVVPRPQRTLSRRRQQTRSTVPPKSGSGPGASWCRDRARVQTPPPRLQGPPRSRPLCVSSSRRRARGSGSGSACGDTQCIRRRRAAAPELVDELVAAEWRRRLL